MPPTIRPAELRDLAELVRLRVALWPHHSAAEAEAETRAILAGKPTSTLPLIHLVADRGDGHLAGFVEVGLRSHSDGCDPRRPVGYIEGWFVDPDVRRQGIGRSLIAAAEEWSRGQGCTEIASDSRLDNPSAHAAHAAVGFERAETVVVFRKSLA